MNKEIKPKRIGIDARFYGPIGKGLGRYTQEIVDNIIEIDKENEYVIFLRKENYDDFVCPPASPGESNKIKKVLADIRWYSLAEQVLMPYYIWKERIDLMHFPHFNVPILCPTKIIITIHDLILTKFPTARATTLGPQLYRIKNLAYKLVIWLGVKRAKKILAVSKFTRNDIAKQFNVNPNKIVVTYEGVANLTRTLSVESEKIIPDYNIAKPFLLYVGNAYPHKNLEGLIKVFKRIIEKQGDMQLVLVGKEDYFYNRIMKYAESVGLWSKGDGKNKVIFPGFVPDEKLEVLYKKALAYIFPSFYEGFGIPPLEAMSRGCPVVSSNKTCMPEVLGDAAIYFNPEDENEMRSQIERIIKDGDLRADLIKRGYERVKKYSWQECARQTLEAYYEVLKKN
jgi:glycosyltransferase involved in cell wall biosynthesis